MKKQLALLRKLGAPAALIGAFSEVGRINAELPDDLKEDFGSLLQEQCRRFGFNDILPDGWFFRPQSCSGVQHRQDTAVTADAIEAPAIEQSYRRGYAQGFARCRELVFEKRLVELPQVEKEIDAWRRRSVQCFRSQPGNIERPPRKLFGGRYSLSLRLRWTVLQRDNLRCVACGHGANDGRALEVDHKVPVSKGGLDTLDNLQTLCDRCNGGKSDS